MSARFQFILPFRPSRAACRLSQAHRLLPLLRPYEFDPHVKRLEDPESEPEISAEFEHGVARLLFSDDTTDFINECDGLAWRDQRFMQFKQVAFGGWRRGCKIGLSTFQQAIPPLNPGSMPITDVNS